uniref:Uncharacterized protein n=1 Tax=Oryza barthii TaxID=65489 RepID=A0A0D3EV20_9ORYZ
MAAARRLLHTSPVGTAMLYPLLLPLHAVNCSFSLHMVHPKLPEYMPCGTSYFLRARVDDIAICMTVPFGYMPRMASVCTPSLRSNTICLEVCFLASAATPRGPC